MIDENRHPYIEPDLTKDVVRVSLLVMRCLWVFWSALYQAEKMPSIPSLLRRLLLLFFTSWRKWKWKSLSLSDSLWPHGLHSPWNSPGQNTGMGSCSLLQGIFPTQGSNPGLPHCRQILYQLRHQGSPRILEWVAYPFSSGSSRPRNQTGVSCIAGGFFTSYDS